MQQDKGFKVGDVVRMSSTGKTKWEHCNSNPHDLTGKILVFNSTGVQVKWSNNMTNSYNIKELELLEPKQEQYYTSIPIDVKNGDKFEIISKTGYKDNFEWAGSKDFPLGEIVTLDYSLQSNEPCFINSKGKATYLNWGCLKPVKVVTNSHLVDVSPTVLFGRDSLGNDDVQQFEIGDEVEIINGNCDIIHYHKIGDKGIITKNPYNNQKDIFRVVVNGHEQQVHFSQIKLIKTNHNYGKVQNSMSFSTTSYKITRGETICSSAIRCSKSKIKI